MQQGAWRIASCGRAYIDLNGTKRTGLKVNVAHFIAQVAAAVEVGCVAVVVPLWCKDATTAASLVVSIFDT